MPEGNIAQEGIFSEEQAVKRQRLEQCPPNSGPSALLEGADAIEDDDCLLLDTVGAVCVSTSGAAPLHHNLADGICERWSDIAHSSTPRVQWQSAAVRGSWECSRRACMQAVLRQGCHPGALL